MESKHLLKSWTGSDNSRLMRNQTSMRLSTHVSAKISALCEMFPQRTKTQIINDLLSTALDELEGGLEDNHPWENSEVGLENLATQKTHYQTLVEKHLSEIDSGDADATSDANAVIRKRTRREK